MTDALLQLQGLTVSFLTSRGSSTVVEDVGFDVRPGEAVGLVGESGCGKSVTAMTLMGLTRHVPGVRIAGSASFDGRDLLRLSDREMARVRGSEIGMVFQDPMASLNPSFTVGEQIAEVVRRHWGWGRKAAMGRAIEMLDMVRIPQAAKRVRAYPHQFSGGMRQRVMIAIALACEPRLLLADEPTTALDTTVQAQILDLLLELQSSLGMALVLITHDLGVMANTCDQVVVMYAGETIERGSVEDVLFAPQHPYTSALIECLPGVSGDRLKGIPGTVPLPEDAHPTCRFFTRCRHATPGVCDAEKVLLHGDTRHEVRCVRSSSLDLPGIPGEVEGNLDRIHEQLAGHDDR